MPFCALSAENTPSKVCSMSRAAPGAISTAILPDSMLAAFRPDRAIPAASAATSSSETFFGSKEKR